MPNPIEIPLTQGKIALVSPEDYYKVAGVGWYAKRYRGGIYYAARGISVNGKQKTVFMHQVIMGVSGRDCLIDHENGDGLDNQRHNLRRANSKQNMGNSKKRAAMSSKYKGVNFRKSSGKFRASIGINGTCIHLGWYKDEDEAARAYDRAAIKHFGEFARLNFPLSDYQEVQDGASNVTRKKAA